MIKRQLLLLVMMILPLCGQADPVYRWVDEKGVVHFSSKPHHEAENVETLEAPVSPRMAETSGDQNMQKDEASTEVVEESVESSSPTPQQIEYCKVLKKNLNTLKNSPRVRMKKDNGEFEILGDEARESEIERISKDIKESC